MNECITPVVLPGTDEPPEQAPVPAERLEAELCLMAGHLAAATSRFLELVGEYDASGGWAAWDMRSCAERLSWRCQIGPGTAREHVRVARALRTLPVTHAEFAAGRMGYSKVREITRITTPATEAGLAEIMTPMTAGQAERLARAYRSCEQDQPGGGREPRSSLRFRSGPDNGEVSVSLCLPPADGAVVLQALRAPPPSRSPPPSQPERRTLLPGMPDVPVGTPDAIARDVPAGTPDLPAGHPAHPDRCHLEDGPAISPQLAQRIACFATLSLIVHGIDGSIAAIGRRSRKIPALRRAVRERDGYAPSESASTKSPACTSSGMKTRSRSTTSVTSALLSPAGNGRARNVTYSGAC